MVVKMIPKICAQNAQVSDRIVNCMTFVHNTTVRKMTRATPISLVFGTECRYPVDLFNPQQPGSEPIGEVLLRSRARFSVKRINKPVQNGGPIRGDRGMYTKERCSTHAQLAIEKGFSVKSKSFRTSSIFLGQFPTSFWNGLLTWHTELQKNASERALANPPFQQVKAFLCFRSSMGHGRHSRRHFMMKMWRTRRKKIVRSFHMDVMTTMLEKMWLRNRFCPDLDENFRRLEHLKILMNVRCSS